MAGERKGVISDLIKYSYFDTFDKTIQRIEYGKYHERRIFHMSSTTDLRKVRPVKWLTVTAMLMALNIAMSSFSIPVPGGHL